MKQKRRDPTVAKLVRRSKPAICGVTEKELWVRKNQVSRSIKKLKSAGYRIVGTSYGDRTKYKRIWYSGRRLL